MKRITIILVLIVLFIGCNNDKKQIEQLESYLELLISEDAIDVYQRVVSFEDYLIKNKFIDDVSKESYIELFKKLEDNKIELNEIQINELYHECYMGCVAPSITMNCFHLIFYAINELDIEIDTSENIYKYIKDVDRKIFEPQDAGQISPELCFSTIDNISVSDFNKFIYRLPIVATVFGFVEYKIRHIYKWKPINGVNFLKNDTLIDFFSSDLSQLDSLCATIDSNFITIMVISVDTLDYTVIQVSEIRTKAIVYYILRNKSIHHRQVNRYRDHHTNQNLIELYKTKKSNLVYWTTEI